MSDSFAITYNGSGMFTMTVDGKAQTFNIADMDLALRMEQVEVWDQEIADQYAEIKESNLKRKALNELLAKMRQYKSEGRDDDIKDGDWSTGAQSGSEMTAAQSDHSKSSDRFKLEGMGDEARSVDGWMDYFGLTKTDVRANTSKEKRDGQWDVNIEAVKGKVDEITSDSELKMLRFRQLVDKRGTALQEAKSTMQQDKRLKDQVLQG